MKSSRHMQTFHTQTFLTTQQIQTHQPVLHQLRRVHQPRALVEDDPSGAAFIFPRPLQAGREHHWRAAARSERHSPNRAAPEQEWQQAHPSGGVHHTVPNGHRMFRHGYTVYG